MLGKAQSQCQRLEFAKRWHIEACQARERNFAVDPINPHVGDESVPVPQVDVYGNPEVITAMIRDDGISAGVAFDAGVALVYSIP